MGAEAEAEGTDFPQSKMFCFHEGEKKVLAMTRRGDPTAERQMPSNREIMPEFPTRSRLLITQGTNAGASMAALSSVLWAGAGTVVRTERCLDFIAVAMGDSGVVLTNTLSSQLLFICPHLTL